MISPAAPTRVSEFDAEAADRDWQRLQATALAVRVRPGHDVDAPHRLKRLARPALVILGATALSILGSGLDHGGHAGANGTANGDLFALTNQDRSSNGVASLQSHSTLGAIGENLPYRGCGFTVYGRSQDMIDRNYFAHPILNCGQLVFSMMQANGIHYLAAGENIGWDSGATGPGAAAQFINTEFMNSAEHRANILNRGFTHMGVGTAQSNSWSGAGGGPYSNVWMFSEEFAQLDGAAMAAIPSVRAANASTPPAVRNDPAPAVPGQPPLVTQAGPTVAPEATPSSDPLASPGAVDGLTPPSIPVSAGSLSDSVEAVLEAYLVD